LNSVANGLVGELEIDFNAGPLFVGTFKFGNGVFLETIGAEFVSKKT